MNRLLRSYLFAPGDNSHLLGKVLSAGADAVVLDLEDAVRPERKHEARGLVAEFLEENRESASPIYVRINPVASALCYDDLAAVVSPSLHGVRLAKAESAGHIAAVDSKLSELEMRAGIYPGATRVVPTIETSTGVFAALEIAKQPRVEALCFGMADFLADIHAEEDSTFTASLYALSHLVLASRAAGILPPVASVHTKLDDTEGLLSSCELYRKLGFFGRSCIHPKQIPVVHLTFTPSREEVEHASAIVESFERQAAAHKGTAVIGEMFIDEAVVRHARDVIALAASLGSPTEERSR